MTIHKSKGKEFDEVLIFEEAKSNRLVRENATAKDVAQSILVLRVSAQKLCALPKSIHTLDEGLQSIYIAATLSYFRHQKLRSTLRKDVQPRIDHET